MRRVVTTTLELALGRFRSSCLDRGWRDARLRRLLVSPACSAAAAPPPAVGLLRCRRRPHVLRTRATPLGAKRNLQHAPPEPKVDSRPFGG
eukprot:2933983-Pleurochrysis_carterae.AAC.1